MTQKEVIKKVLDEFFSVKEEVTFDGYLGFNLDEEETEILSEAIDQALRKEHENQGQPQ